MTKNNPHVMHVIDSLAPGGAERMLVDIANNIDRDQFSVSVCITRSNNALAKVLHPDIPFMALDRKWRFDPKGFTRFKQFSNEHSVDIFHVHGRTSFAFLLMARVLGLCKSPLFYMTILALYTLIKVHPYGFDIRDQKKSPIILVCSIIKY